MHSITELPAWERLLKRIAWKQVGEIKGKRILDFGSGEGVTANHFAKNEVVAVKPSEEMLESAWRDFSYKQIQQASSSIRNIEEKVMEAKRWNCCALLLRVTGLRCFIRILPLTIPQSGFS